MAQDQDGDVPLNSDSNHDDEATDAITNQQVLLYQLLQYAVNAQNTNNNNNNNNSDNDDNDDNDENIENERIMNFYNLLASHQEKYQESSFTDPNIEYTSNEGKLSMDINKKFRKISLNKKLNESGLELNNMIYSIYKINIPCCITNEIILYTLSLIPGIYNFQGKMSDGWSEDNDCLCRIVLDDNCCIIGGCFQEIYFSPHSTEPQSSFEYEITNGTYNYINGGIEFIKWYFPFNYQYKIIGQIVYKTVNNNNNNDNSKMDVENQNENENEKEIEIWFKGKWQRLTTRRSGILNMKLTNKSVVLEHAIKPGKYVFFGLSSWEKQENGYNINMKIDVEFLKYGVVKGKIYLFDHEWSINYDQEEIENGIIQCPDNEFAYNSHEIIDGEWHHFGKIVFVFDNNKQQYGFFNGKFFIGEWHTYNNNKYISTKWRNGDSNDDEEKNEDLGKDEYEQRAKDRIGHFEFTFIDDIDKSKKTRLVATARGGVVSVMANDNNQHHYHPENEDNEDEENQDEKNDGDDNDNVGILYRNVSLDSDDNDDHVQ